MSGPTEVPELRRDRRGWKTVRVVGAGITVAIGLFVAYVTVALGHCSAFGGSCPSEGLEGDVIGGIAIGLGSAIAGPMIAWRPDRFGLLLALVAGGGVGLLVALMVAPTLTQP